MARLIVPPMAKIDDVLIILHPRSRLHRQNGLRGKKAAPDMDIEHLVENLERDFLDFQPNLTHIIDKNINLTNLKEPTAKIVEIYDVGNGGR